MEILLEGTGITVKGNFIIQELEILIKSLFELVESDRNSIQLDLSNVVNEFKITLDKSGTHILPNII